MHKNITELNIAFNCLTSTNNGKNSTILKPVKTPSSIDVPINGLPTIRLAGRFPLDDREFSVRYLGSHYSLHLYAYEGTIRIGTRQYAIRPGDVTLTPPNVASRYDLPAPGYHLCVHFSLPATRGERASIPLHLSLGIRRDVASQKLAQIIQHQSRAARSAVARAAACAGMLELLLWLAQSHRAPRGARVARAGRADAAVDRAMTLLEQSLDTPLDVPSLADEVELSQNYLAKHFRMRFGLTLQRYLLSRRIDFAQHLLTTTNLSVGRIGERVGLPDPQHFNKQFRRLVGLSPSQVRDQAARAQAHWPRRWRILRQQLEANEK